MFIRKLALAACVVASGSLPTATISGAQAPPAPGAPEALRAHVEFLADDLLEGRGTGTRGFDLAALYVAAQFRAAGLDPAIEGGWYQQVPLVERTPTVGPDARLSIGDAAFPLGEQAVAVISGEGAQQWSGEAVFGGYGMAEPIAGIDDWAGFDLRGKALVLFEAAPSALSPELARVFLERRIESASERGAAGVILIGTAPRNEADWSALRSDFALPFFNWLQADGTPYRRTAMRFSATLQPEAAARLFIGSAYQFAQLQALAVRGEPLPAFALTQRVTIEAGSSWRRFASPNVVGTVRGRGALAGECVLVTSHLDHLGSDHSVSGEDKIFNGALDNASGIAALIEVARAVAASPVRPERSLVFVATTGEEIGLLGSDYLAEHPLDACERTVAVVNLDGGVPLDRLLEASAYGGWHSTIGATFDRVATSIGIRPVPESSPPTEFFARTDHYSFARRGVPAIYLVMGGDDEQFLAAYRGRYHEPSDDLTLPFNWEAGAQFARLAHLLVRELADAPEAPRWYADSPFAQRFARSQPLIARPPD